MLRRNPTGPCTLTDGLNEWLLYVRACVGLAMFAVFCLHNVRVCVHIFIHGEH